MERERERERYRTTNCFRFATPAKANRGYEALRLRGPDGEGISQASSDRKALVVGAGLN